MAIRAARSAHVLTPSSVATVAEAAGKGPCRLAPLGDGFVVLGQGRKNAAALDAALGLRASFPLKAHGQIAGSEDGQRIAAATVGGVRVFDVTGKIVRKEEDAEWWEENSGAVCFVGDRVVFVCIPDEELLDEKLAVGVLDLGAKKAAPVLATLEFGHEAHHRLYPLPSGGAVLWSNAQQDAQGWFHVELAEDGPQVKKLPVKGAPGFLHWIDGEDVCVSGDSAVSFFDAETGKTRRTISLDHALGEDDELLAAAPHGEKLLLHVLSFRARTQRLLEVDATTSREVTVEGTRAGTVTGMATSARSRTLLTFEDGTVAILEG
ncbi:MAG: hypothetical protein JNL79_39010 [Myxococcales bacterium]|nr:hypothetical protein [Myxococcales bacterium]